MTGEDHGKGHTQNSPTTAGALGTLVQWVGDPVVLISLVAAEVSAFVRKFNFDCKVLPIFPFL